MLKRSNVLPLIAQDVGLVVVAATILINQWSNGGPWWLAGIISLALLILYHNWPERHPQLYLAVEFAFIVPLLCLHFISIILFFAFSAHAMILFPNRKGALWIILAVLATISISVYNDGWLDGLITSIGVSMGYLGFGYAYFALTQAETERRKSQALFVELESAHQQLQETLERVEELAISEERNRIAREMHDTLGHRLTVAAVQLEGAGRLIFQDPHKAQQMITTVRKQVGEALSELRQTVATLRTPLEADLSLPAALKRLASGFEEATGLTIQLSIPESFPELPPAQRLALFRVAQESLTNVQRHAQANQVWLKLSFEKCCVKLCIADDGIGIGSDAVNGGFGLPSMHERAILLGGELSMSAQPEGGTMIEISLPLPAEAEDA